MQTAWDELDDNPGLASAVSPEWSLHAKDRPADTFLPGLEGPPPQARDWHMASPDLPLSSTDSDFRRKNKLV